MGDEPFQEHNKCIRFCPSQDLFFFSQIWIFFVFFSPNAFCQMDEEYNKGRRFCSKNTIGYCSVMMQTTFDFYKSLIFVVFMIPYLTLFCFRDEKNIEIQVCLEMKMFDFYWQNEINDYSIFWKVWFLSISCFFYEDYSLLIWFAIVENLSQILFSRWMKTSRRRWKSFWSTRTKIKFERFDF